MFVMNVAFSINFVIKKKKQATSVHYDVFINCAN